MAKQQLLLIGHGMVGQRYLESLVAQGGREHFDITVLCACLLYTSDAADE